MGVHFLQHSQLPMLVMEYLPLSLTQCLETHHNFLLQIKYSILLDVAKGLNYLHCKRPPIVHRDLTANNILLTSNFIAKISDLGVSRMTDTFKQQQLTKAPGNAIVMPPEALMENPSYDHKLDVFSYGCLVLHVFTHQWPVPTAQYVPIVSLFRRGSYDLVTEWDRRSKYTTTISSDNPFLPFAKSCLDNDPMKRPTMSDAIICAEHAVSSLPPMKNTLVMMNDISSLTEKVKILKEEKEVLKSIEKKEKKATEMLEKKDKELQVTLANNSFLNQTMAQKDKEISKLFQNMFDKYQNDIGLLQEECRQLQQSMNLDDPGLLARFSGSGDCPPCLIQKDIIFNLMTHTLKKGDKW